HCRAHDTGQRLLQRFQNFVGVQGKAAWNTFSQVTATHFDFTYFVAWVSRTDFVLDTLCCRFTDQRTVVTTNVVNDGFVETVTTNTLGRGVHHAVQGDNGHFSSTATDTHHQRTGRFRHRQTRTDCRRHWLFNQEHFTSTCTLRGFTD